MKPPTQHEKDVIEYYDSTKREYKVIWKNDENLGVHFGYYDAEHQDHSSAVTNMNRKLAELVDLKQSDAVFDAGCGVGGTCFWFTENIGCDATGITLVPWHYDKANQLVAEKQLEDKVNFVLGDYQHTGLDAGSYTFVLGLESIVHATDKQAVVNEAFRLLKPGGRMAICEYMLVSEDLQSDEKRLIQQWLDGWSMPSILSDDQYEKIATNAGFENVAFHDWTDSVRPSFARLDKYIKLLMPVNKLLRRLRMVNDRQITNLLGSNAQMRALEMDLWRYKVMVAEKPAE